MRGMPGKKVSCRGFFYRYVTSSVPGQGEMGMKGDEGFDGIPGRTGQPGKNVSYVLALYVVPSAGNPTCFNLSVIAVCIIVSM